VVVGAIVLLAGARESDAYVRYKSASGASFAWMPSCLPLPIAVYPGSFTQVPVGEISGAASGATAAWSAGANACTFIEFAVTVATGPAPRVGNDRHNAIIFRDTSWCRLDATGACDPAVAYDPAALALTSVSARTSTGEIIDADIEVNAFHFLWADLVAHPELTTRHDLQNALTHELGHVLGLDHTCYLSGAPPIDNAGQPIPDCANASAAVIATTMFPSANPGDISLRTLEPDDRAGVCGIYPAAASPCPPGDAGCACPPPGADGGQDADSGSPDTGGGSPDAAPDDAGSGSPDAPPADAGKTSPGGGCNCALGAPPARRLSPAALFVVGALAAAARRRRPRS